MAKIAWPEPEEIMLQNIFKKNIESEHDERGAANSSKCDWKTFQSPPHMAMTVGIFRTYPFWNPRNR
jgi:hypothetical protein